MLVAVAGLAGGRPRGGCGLLGAHRPAVLQRPEDLLVGHQRQGALRQHPDQPGQQALVEAAQALPLPGQLDHLTRRGA